ncbi:MAG: ABC transporter ATP-binding protein [Candidatus Electrothrix sp. AR3]|nr:ABC transporter ATP-binding protein [Candidatus Electrothrix sp. AR3]
MNGAILGMSKTEIKKKLDEIIDFSGVSNFIDTPVKRYSSGMYVRLAFAVAAHLDPEILVIDEVLAVGDAEFQKKCLGKMGEVSRQGRTVLFVSHNLAAVEQLCSRGILLKAGQVVCDANTKEIITFYKKTSRLNCPTISSAYSVNETIMLNAESSGVRITGIQFLNLHGDLLKKFRTGDGLILRIGYKSSNIFKSPSFRVQLKNHMDVAVMILNNMPMSGYPIKELANTGYVDLLIEELPLTAGDYYFTIGIAHERRDWVVRLDDVAVLTVSTKDIYKSGMAIDNTRGILALPHRWKHISHAQKAP